MPIVGKDKTGKDKESDNIGQMLKNICSECSSYEEFYINSNLFKKEEEEFNRLKEIFERLKKEVEKINEKFIQNKKKER